MRILKLLLFLSVNSTAFTVFGQSTATKCNCRPIKLYVYDTKLDFPPDNEHMNDASYVGAWKDAQNSGDWLLGAYFKQQTDEFKIYKGLRPGAKKVTSYELPPDKETPDGNIDFTSYVQIDRSLHDGKYSYKVLIAIKEVYRNVAAIIWERSTDDLGRVDDLIDQMISENSPIINQLRDYQEHIRDVSLSASDDAEHMWIDLKYKVVAEKTKLKVGEATKVHIRVFDCPDQKPVTDQRLNLKVGSPKTGVINTSNTRTNSAGEATVIFTAVSEGETSIFPDFTYTGVNGRAGYHVLRCGDLQEIDITRDDRNYFYLSNSVIPGTFYEVKEPLLASFRATQDRADYVNDQWNIMVNGMRKMTNNNSAMQPMSMVITVTQSDTGTYNWSVHGDCNKDGLTPPFNSVTVVGTGTDGIGFSYSSSDCSACESEHCKLFATDGSTTITVFDKKNKIIKGNFSGTLVSPTHQSVHVSGAFMVHMILMP